MHTIEAGWLSMLFTFLGVFVFMAYWGKIDGTERWERRQREADKKAEAEGWKKWAIGKES